MHILHTATFVVVENISVFSWRPSSMDAGVIFDDQRVRQKAVGSLHSYVEHATAAKSRVLSHRGCVAILLIRDLKD